MASWVVVTWTLQWTYRQTLLKIFLFIMSFVLQVYEELLRKEDEYNKMTLEMSGYAPSVGTMGTYPGQYNGYGTKDSYAPSGYDQG